MTLSRVPRASWGTYQAVKFDCTGKQSSPVANLVVKRNNEGDGRRNITSPG